MAKKKQTYNDIVGQERPTLVDFYATWCGPCKMMQPILKELSAEVGDQAKVLKIDIDKNQALAQKLGIRSVPTLAIYKRGKIVWRQSGAMGKGQLLKELKQHYA